MSRRMREPEVDAKRTHRLGLPELWVQADCGGDYVYYTFPKWMGVPFCPRCGSANTTVHLTRTRILRDVLPDAQGPERFIELHFTYRSYQCSDCKNIFTPTYQFAGPKARVTRRFEEFLVRAAMSRSLGSIAEQTGYSITPSAIKTLIDRWVQAKAEAQPPMFTAQTLCLLAYENSQSYGLLVLNVDGGRIYLADVLPDTGAENIRAVLRRVDPGGIRQVITDLTESTAEAPAERLPGVLHLIDPGVFYSLVQEQLRWTAEQQIRWLPMRDKMETILTPRKRLLVSQQYTFRQVLQRRPELTALYNAYDGLYNILTESWSTLRLTEWAQAICQNGPESLSPIAQSLLDNAPGIKLYEQAGFPAMRFSAVSDQMTRCTRQLRPCSFALEQARLLYLNVPDTVQLEDGTIRRLGVPIEKVYDTLQQLQIEQERIYEP